MNALVGYRSNQSGQLSPTRDQRKAAMEEITANLRVKMQAQLKAAQGPSNYKAGESSSQDGELGKDAFLQLLVMQMQYQDPLDPVDNVDMIAQLAQFSSLEQMNNLNDNFTELSDRFEYFSGNMDQLNFISAQGLLGKYVTGVNGAGEEISGQVEAVQLSGSIVVLTVDGKLLPMTGVLSVGTEAPETPEETPDDTTAEKRAQPAPPALGVE